jgi:hypothetical protein
MILISPGVDLYLKQQLYSRRFSLLLSSEIVFPITK